MEVPLDELKKIIQKKDRNRTVYTVWMKHVWIRTQALPFFSNKIDAVPKMTVVNETGIWKPSASALEVGMRMLHEAEDNEDVLSREAEHHFCAWGIL